MLVEGVTNWGWVQGGGGDGGGRMEMEKNKTGEKTENKDREQKGEELHRITVSKQAERALSAVVERINEG